MNGIVRDDDDWYNEDLDLHDVGIYDNESEWLLPNITFMEAVTEAEAIRRAAVG